MDKALVGAPFNRLLQSWDDKGNPIQVTVPQLSKPQINQIVLAAVSAPYDDPLLLEPRYAGWSNMEVMMHKLASRAALTGASDDIKDLLNRILGSPLQKSENVTMNISYEDKLREIAKASAKPIIDVQAVPPYQGEDDPLA